MLRHKVAVGCIYKMKKGLLGSASLFSIAAYKTSHAQRFNKPTGALKAASLTNLIAARSHVAEFYGSKQKNNAARMALTEKLLLNVYHKIR